METCQVYRVQHTYSSTNVWSPVSVFLRNQRLSSKLLVWSQVLFQETNLSGKICTRQYSVQEKCKEVQTLLSALSLLCGLLSDCLWVGLFGCQHLRVISLGSPISVVYMFSCFFLIYFVRNAAVYRHEGKGPIGNQASANLYLFCRSLFLSQAFRRANFSMTDVFIDVDCMQGSSNQI